MRLSQELKDMAQRYSGRASELFELSAYKVEELEKIQAENASLAGILKRFVAIADDATTNDPIEVGCHCTDSGDAPIVCAWCDARDALAKLEGDGE